MVARTALHRAEQDSHSSNNWWDPQNDHSKAAFMEWIESMDFFGCDENVPKTVFNGVEHTLRIPFETHRGRDLQRVDYAKLHDQLLESLMAEQSKKANDPTSGGTVDSSASGFSFSSTMSLSQKSASLNTSVSTVNSASDLSVVDAETVSDISLGSNKRRNNKRPRALKLSRRVMPVMAATRSVGSNNEKTMKRKLSSNSSVGSTRSSATTSSKRDGDAVSVSLSDLNAAVSPPAYAFIHPQCRLQKDKGKGEEVGSNICAKGREHCLLKLEQKMAVLTRVAFGEESKNKGTADMKRRPARVAEIFPHFTETRSIIELRMGFMSMQYGILLRWDTSKTGKVVLVVLRKMCSDSFYSKCKKTVPRKTSSSASPRKMLRVPAEVPSSCLRNVVDGNHAILQRPDGMEVALLEPPYRVDRPDEFQPSRLSVSVQYGTGLSRKSSWTVQLSHGNKKENILLTWDAELGIFSPKLGETLKTEIPVNGSFDLPSLEVLLFEHRQKLGKSRRCVSHMHLPLLGLEAQQTKQRASPKDVKVVSTHDPDACITLSVLLESDYAHWLRHELDARRREEVKDFSWKKSLGFMGAYDSVPAVVELDDDEEDSIWDWICGVC